MTMSGERVRILVADDDLVSRMAMEDALRAGPPSDVTVVVDGPTAWDALRGEGGTGPFDLVCLDVRMPPPDGLEIAERIRHTPALKRLPVMLITSTADRGTMMSATKLQLQGFLVKPVGAEMPARIAKVIEQLDASILEPAAATIARLGIDAARHARYVAAYVQQVQALAALGAQVDGAGGSAALRAQFVARSEAVRAASLTLGAVRLEQVVGDAAAAAAADAEGAASAMAQAIYWLQRVVRARGLVG
jgi:CheY-like chemotaxis protein